MRSSLAWSNVRPGTYSVWNWDLGRFDYYEARKPKRKYGDKVEPPPAQLGGVLGEDPDVSGHILPSGSRYVGSGQQALGEIAYLPKTRMGMAALAGVAMAIAAPIALLWGAVKAAEIARGR